MTYVIGNDEIAPSLHAICTDRLHPRVNLRDLHTKLITKNPDRPFQVDPGDFFARHLVGILLDELPHIRSRGAKPFLNAAHQLVILAFRVSQIVVGEVAVGLLELTFYDIPVTLHV